VNDRDSVESMADVFRKIESQRSVLALHSSNHALVLSSGFAWKQS